MMPKHFYLSALLPVLLFMSAGCRTEPAAVKVPAVNVEEMVAQGDSSFQRDHLHGWRKAESLYRKAYELQPSEILRNKLLVTRVLILTRERDEDILDPSIDSSLGELCSTGLGPKQKLLCDLGKTYKRRTVPREGEAPDPSLFDLEGSALDAYLYMLCLQDRGVKEQHEAEAARAEKFRDSPLFIYLYMGKGTLQRAAEIEKSFPDFAEWFDFKGGTEFQRTRYSSARSGFEKAVELIPDYTRSWNGLGNISLFVLEDYDKALAYYRRALERDSGNAAALYGTGIVSHSLGRYEESNAYLDRMLQSDLSRGGGNSAEAVAYYRGQANYYKAYNFHLLENEAKAREFVELARRDIPKADCVNYLSGLLHYQSGELRAARDDFMRVVQSGSANCDAQFYLGRIYREATEDPDLKPLEQTAGTVISPQLAELLKQVQVPKESMDQRSLNYFLGACACMEANINGMERQIKDVAGMDLSAEEKVVFTGRLQSKLAGYRRSSVSLIDGMLNLSSSSGSDKRDVYLNLMEETRGHIEASPNSQATKKW